MKAMKAWMVLGLAIFPGMGLAGPIYSTVDANGNRVFSDASTGKSSDEVKLNEATVVSGDELGKKVYYKYGRPESGQGSWSHTHPQLQQMQERKKDCERMKNLMNSTAGRIKLNTENRYNRECILGQ